MSRKYIYILYSTDNMYVLRYMYIVYIVSISLLKHPLAPEGPEVSVQCVCQFLLV